MKEIEIAYIGNGYAGVCSVSSGKPCLVWEIENQDWLIGIWKCMMLIVHRFVGAS